MLTPMMPPVPILGGHPGKSDGRHAVFALRILVAVGSTLRPGQAEFVHDRWAENLRPSEHGALRIQIVPAPRRRRAAVEYAAEPSRHETKPLVVAIAAEKVVVRRCPQVESTREAIVVVGDVRLADEVARPRRIRHRHHLEDRRRNRIDAGRWNRVVEERLSGQRIAYDRRENAAALVGCRHRSRPQHAACDPCAFVIDEEEGAPRLDRAAQAAAELVLAVGRLRQTRTIREERVRIEPLIAEIVVAGSPKRVRARFCRDRDCGARCPAVLRRERGRHHFEFADRID